MDANIMLRPEEAVDLEIVSGAKHIISFNVVAEEYGLVITTRSKEWNLSSLPSQLNHKTIFVRLVKA